jgi:hypothetical protein
MEELLPSIRRGRAVPALLFEIKEIRGIPLELFRLEHVLQDEHAIREKHAMMGGLEWEQEWGPSASKAGALPDGALALCVSFMPM